MRNIKPRASFEAYLSGKKAFEVIEEGYGNTNTIPPKQAEPVNTTHTSTDQFKQLVEAVKQYRHYQKLYFAKLKKKEFAKDEQHFMMKYQEKIDLLLKHLDKQE